MGYDQTRCYWCGRKLPKGKTSTTLHTIYSLATDTLKTRRNFCSVKHLKKFKKIAKRNPRTGSYLLPPYKGRWNTK